MVCHSRLKQFHPPTRGDGLGSQPLPSSLATNDFLGTLFKDLNQFTGVGVLNHFGNEVLRLKSVGHQQKISESPEGTWNLQLGF